MLDRRSSLTSAPPAERRPAASTSRCLSKNDPSPFAPESDEERTAKPGADKSPTPATADEKKPRGRGRGTREADSSRQRGPSAGRHDRLRRDISQRILAMPLPGAHLHGLTRRQGRHRAGPRSARAGFGVLPERPCTASTLRQRRGDVLVSGVRFFEVSANGEKVLTAQGDRWTIPERATTTAGEWWPRRASARGWWAGVFRLRTDDIELQSAPTLEWKQMYHDAWRIQREFFSIRISTGSISRRDQALRTVARDRSSHAAT